MVILRIQQKPVLASEQEAVGPLTALAGVLASASRSGCLWARLRGRLVPFDLGTIELLLAAERSFHAGAPGEFTHVVSLCSTSEGLGEVGVVLLNVRPGAVVGAAPGLVVSVSLGEEVFDTGVDALLRLVGTCLGALSPDSVLVGPRGWLRELRAGWATFTRTVHRELLPAGAVLDVTHGGALILAHAEDPASESAAARNAIAQVRAAIDGSSPTQALEPWPVPAVSSQHPTYLVPLPLVLDRASLPLCPALPFADDPHPQRGFAIPVAQGAADGAPPLFARAPAELCRTSDAVSARSGPVFPFVAGAPVAEPVASRVRAPAKLSSTSLAVEVPSGPTLPFVAGRLTDPPHVHARAPTELTGTMAAVDTSGRPVLPFVEQTSPAPIGLQLTLEQYAALRAQLTVRGEDDQGTLRLFGVTSPAAKEALQACFAERFRLDAAVQARFVDLVRTLTGELRRQTPPRSQ
jgi:hypothetical protein